MAKSDREIIDISENDILQMFDDTSQLIAAENASQLSLAAEAAKESNALTNDVEFWNWMGRNFKEICGSNNSMQQYISQSATKENWMATQMQGKGYEWDWMSRQRGMAKNLFNTYNAGDVSNKAASDITETNLLSGGSKEYQMKAYTSKNKPHLKNTPKDMTVVTNAEKTAVVKADGYQEVNSFQNKSEIEKATNARMKQIKDGKAYTSYNFKNVAGTMAKAGLLGCAIGIGTEAVFSYKAWKAGNLTDGQYLKEILKSGGDAGVTASATSGIMIPISAAITAAGASSLITIPIAFVIGGAINKIVAPCFGRGKYRELLSKAQYYQNLESVYGDLTDSMQNAAEQYYGFISHMVVQNAAHQEMKRQSMEINEHLEALYHSI